MISVLCPSRNRTARLERSISSLRTMARRPDLVEVLVAADPDDPGTAAAALGWPSFTAVTGERHGYARLHEYYNLLASCARGEWLFLWNDDAVMETEHWDTRVYAQQPGVLWPASNDDPSCNVFPLWPRSWYAILGHVSLSPHCDTWVQELGQGLGCQRRVPVTIRHDTPRLGGTANDQVYADASYRTAEFYGGEMRAARQADIDKLRSAGRNESWLGRSR